MSQTTPAINKDEILSEWVTSLKQLISQVSMWVQEKEDWAVMEQTKEISEESLGAYTASALKIITPEAELNLEPVARVVFGGQGSVELSVWPSLLRVRLVRRPKVQGELITKPDEIEWVILLEGIKWPNDWGQETFYELVERLVKAQVDIEI